MKFHQKDFTEELKTKINNTESVLKEHNVELSKDYKSIFSKKKLILNVDFDKEGEDPFEPGYSSSLVLGVSDRANKNGELMDLHRIKIWECERIFLGIPISANLPGSKIIGELLDESVEEIKEELKEYIEEFLNEG
ncbi:hypothetical protein [Bacillus sp. RO1]|uniref:hypothetical protein n=1 Tax=Bacillus sp. RO1 TaxID=2722703 RepID=UPI0014577C38|nr:hypothetical protein [Bacillus sp. RO1]NLP52428.1 hypothetical protein [Bacillus sp. RO1]